MSNENNFAVFIYASLDHVLDCAYHAHLGVEQPVVDTMESVNVINYEDAEGNDCKAFAVVIPITRGPMARRGPSNFIIPGVRWQYLALNIFVFTDDGVREEKFKLPEIPSCAVSDIFTDLKVCLTPTHQKLLGNARFSTRFNHDKWAAAQYFKIRYHEVNADQLLRAVIMRKVANFTSELKESGIHVKDAALVEFVRCNATLGTTQS